MVSSFYASAGLDSVRDARKVWGAILDEARAAYEAARAQAGADSFEAEKALEGLCTALRVNDALAIAEVAFDREYEARRTKYEDWGEDA